MSYTISSVFVVELVNYYVVHSNSLTVTGRYGAVGCNRYISVQSGPGGICRYVKYCVHSSTNEKNKYTSLTF